LLILSSSLSSPPPASSHHPPAGAILTIISCRSPSYRHPTAIGTTSLSLLLRSTRSLVDPIILPLKSSSSRLVSSSSCRRHPHNYLLSLAILPSSYRHWHNISYRHPLAILTPSYRHPHASGCLLATTLCAPSLMPSSFTLHLPLRQLPFPPILASPTFLVATSEIFSIPELVWASSAS